MPDHLSGGLVHETKSDVAQPPFQPFYVAQWAGSADDVIKMEAGSGAGYDTRDWLTVFFTQSLAAILM